MRLDFWDLKSSGCLFFSYVVWCVKVQSCLNSFCYHAGKHVAESNKKTSSYIVLAFPAAQDKKIVVMTFLLWLDLPFVSHYLSLVLCHRFPVGRLHQPSREHQAFFLESIRARCCQSLPLRHPSSTVLVVFGYFQLMNYVLFGGSSVIWCWGAADLVHNTMGVWSHL